MTVAPLPPGATIGILGGGQLGRMLAIAAAELGFRCHVYCPDRDSPASDVAAATTVAAYADEPALAAFADAVDVVTYEFENVPVAPLVALEGRAPLRPSVRSLEIAQDRLTEKRFLDECGIAVARHHPIGDPGDVEAAVRQVGLPAILKTRRLGYDGKGQARIEAARDADRAFDDLGRVPSILETVVPFVMECSSVVAAAADGALAVFAMARNEHESGVLRRSTVPAGLEPRLAAQAAAAAGRAAKALGHIGVFTVEWFVTEEAGGNRLVANEIAPRVHNSGHWTQDAALTSQFEQHIRAIAGWPLGDPLALGPVEMENLIGDDVLRAAAIAAEPRAKLHLYGKTERRPGRKMGHVNRPRAGTA